MKDVATIAYHYINAKMLEKKFKTKKELRDWQKMKIDNFIKKTLSRSPFYKDYTNLPFNSFPIINKKIMMENLTYINTKNIKKEEALKVALASEKSRDFSPMIEKISIGLSSGTSGSRGVFLANQHERLKWTGIMLAKALPNSLLSPCKIAFFLRANNQLYNSVKKQRNIDFNFFDLTKPFSQNIDNLHKYQPQILVAPASVLLQIARKQEKGEINIFPIKIFSVAEVLDYFDRIYIEKIFKQRLSEIYQCTEGFLGITDRSGKIRLNEEYLYIEKEWIDKKSGRFVPIITDFSRTTQPIVRYRLDDVLIEDFCDGPFTYLKEIEGRHDDIFFLESEENNKPIPIFSELLRNTLAQSRYDFNEYKIVQHSLDKIEIMLHPKPNKVLQDHIIKLFIRMCKNQLCKTPKIQITKYDLPISNKKLKRIENRCKISKNYE